MNRRFTRSNCCQPGRKPLAQGEPVRRLGLRLRHSLIPPISGIWNGGSTIWRAIGVEADLILLHPYDRWGFSRMTPHAG